MKIALTCLSCLLLLCLSALGAEAGVRKPLKVFILAGQSNMEGHASVETFDYIGDDPATAPLLKQMCGVDGKPTVCEGAWMSYLTGPADGSANGEGLGKLTAGFGARGESPTEDGGNIGPEFTFGLTMDAVFAEPVLIIKTAWGGRSLNTEFRPPSAGPYELNEFQKKLYYGPPGHGVPDYEPLQGYEVAGFVWLQGFNDLVDGHTYPDDVKAGRFDKYSEWLAHFIRDVRRDVGAPKMPFVIGVLGVGGRKADDDTKEFRKAMAAPAALPEFKGNVVAVETAPFWSEELAAIEEKREKVEQMRWFLDSKHEEHANADGKMTHEQKKAHVKKFEAKLITPADEALWKRGASNGGYHYLGCAKTFALMGKAFAEANLTLLKKPSTK